MNRVDELCAELAEIVDAERERCESDECELVCCVVHDCVRTMRRVVTEWESNSAMNIEAHHLHLTDVFDRRSN